MSYTVRCDSEAEQELATLWMDAARRGDVTRAAHALDLQLQTDAHTKGESREDGKRVLFEPPLGLLFEVLPDERLVRVLHVWSFRTPDR